MPLEGAKLVHAWPEHRVDTVGRAGQTITELIAGANGGHLDPMMVEHGRVLIGENIIPARLWHVVRPKAGSVVVVRLVPQGGNALRIVLMLAIVVAAAYLGPLAAGAIGFTASAVGTAGAAAAAGVATGVISAAGMMLLNALIPQRMPTLNTRQPSQTYSISGARNSASPWGVVPVVLGRHRMAPLYLARPYTEVVGQNQYLRLYFLWGYGPLEIEDMRIGETLLADYDDVEVEHREGLPDDHPITLYPGQVLEEALSIHLDDNGEWFVRRTEPDTDEISIDISFSQGLVKYDKEKGTPKVTSAEFEIEMQRVGEATWVPILTKDVEEKRQEPFRIGHRWKPDSRGQFDVRIRRLNEETADIRSRMDWTALRSIRAEEPFNFPFPVCRTAIRIRAQNQLQGVIDSLTGIANSRCPDWDAASETWITRRTSSPASLYRYMHQHPANPKPRTDAQLDLPGLQDWHGHCVALGLEFNQVRDFEASVDDARKDIAAAGHATPTLREGKRGVVIDRPQAIVRQLITPKNSWGFQGQRTYRDLSDAWRVRFSDRESEWSPNAERIIYREGVDAETATEFEQIEFPGVTDPARIWLDGQRRFRELGARANGYTLNMDWEHLFVSRGDLVRVAHDTLGAGQASGRVKAVHADLSPVVLVLDEPVTMEAGKLYAIDVRLQDNTHLVRSVVTIPGSANAVRLAGSGYLPMVGDLYTFGEADRVTREMVVKNVETAEHLSARLTLVDYAPEIYEAEALTPPEWVPRQPQRDNDVPAPPRIIAISSGDATQTVGQDGTVLSPVTVGIAPGGGGRPAAAQFELRHRPAGSLQQWISIVAEATSAAIRILGYSPDDQVEMQVRSISGAGRVSPWAPIEPQTYLVLGRTIVPPDVDTLVVERLPSGMRRYSWTYADPEGDGLPTDLAGVELRYRAGMGWTWDDLLPLHSGLQVASPWETTAPGAAGTFTFGAIARNRSGIASAVPKIITAALGFGLPPSAPTVTMPSGTLTNDPTPDIPGTGVTGTVAHVMVDGVEKGTAPVIGGVWTATLSTITDGSHAVWAIVVDGDGNPSPPSAAITLVVDATAPAAPTISGPTTVTTTDTTPPFSGTGENGDTVQLYRGGSTPAAAPAVVAGGVWAVDLTAQAIGGYSITAKQVDAAGNVSPASSPAVTLNIIPPSIAIATPAGGTSTYDRRQPCTGAGAIAGATIKLYSGVTQYGTATADGSGNWTLTPSSDIPLGTAAYHVTQTSSGQESAAGSTTSLTVVAIDSDAWAYIAAMTVRPSFARQTLIKTLVESLKAGANSWAELDALYVLAAHDAQAARLNAKAPGTFALSAVSSPTFTVDLGYIGTGAGTTPGGYLSSGFNPATAGGQYALNDAHLSVWVRTASSSTSNGAMSEIGNGQAFISSKNATAGQIITRMNDNVSTGVAAGTPNSTEFFCISRAGSGAYSRYHNAASLGDLSQASTSIFNDTIYLLRRGTTTYSDAQISAASIGGALTPTQAGEFYAALHTYLVAVGAAV